MKKSRISDSEVKLIVILVSLVMLACAYFFGYNMCLKNAKAIQEENEAEKVEIARLKDMVARRPDVEAETERCRQEVREIREKYPVDVPTEKAIYLLQCMEDEVGVVFSNIGFAMHNLVAAVGSDGSEGCYANLTMAYNSNYEDFKEMVHYVQDFKDRMVIPAVSAAYDEVTGELSGTVNIRMYYLTGNMEEYEQLPDLEIESGVECIFGGDGVRGQATGNPDAEQTGNEGEG